MRVLRGRAADPEADAAVTRRLLERAAESDEEHLRVWRPHRQCSFGRRDIRMEDYEAAREAAEGHDFPPTERNVGGRPVAYTGSTVAVALATPVEDFRSGIDDRYESITMAVQRAVWRLGVPVQRGEPPDSFCPGQHSLQWGGKLAGFAQRVQRDAALVSGIVIVRDHGEIATVLNAVYDALGLAFDPDSVSSIARAEGRADPEVVVEEIESSLVGEADAVAERVEAALDAADREG